MNRTEATVSGWGLRQPAFIPVSLFPLILGLTACAQSVSTPPPAGPPEPQVAVVEPAPPPVDQTHAPVTILSDVGFLTPESVYFDRKRDVYLVSNINGSPHDKDGNGFISKVTPDGEVTLKFIDGASENINLDAPKGLTISADTLYVADIDRVRMFDALTGEAQGEIEIKGSTFVNDVATGADGLIYVSDSGLDREWKPNGTAAIYTIKGGKVKTLITSKTDLGSPNGLIGGKDGVWVTTGSGELYWISAKGKLSARQKMSGGGNDGLVVTSDGRTLISSWEDGAVWSGTPGGEFHKEVSGLDAPADIGFDCQRDRVLIPLFKQNTVIFHTLSEVPPEAVEDQESTEEESTEEVALPNN